MDVWGSVQGSGCWLTTSLFDSNVNQFFEELPPNVPMSDLVSISVPAHPGKSTEAELSAHRVHTLPVLVIAAHNQCSCRCVMCDIWKIRDPQEITPGDLERLLTPIRELGVRWVVFTGGEPQSNAKLFTLAKMLRAEGIRITLLTAGLLLGSQADLVATTIDDIIISLDGPPTVHDEIRRVPRAFETITAGVKAVRWNRPEMVIRARCTVQKRNHRELRAVVRTAKAIGLNSVSFLPADVTSSAFNRSQAWSTKRQDQIALTAEEVNALAEEAEAMIRDHRQDFESGFVVETPAKLRRMVSYFRAQLGEQEHTAPRCNAPWVSAVIEATGDVRPCFFHSPIGNIHHNTLHEIINGPAALDFRSALNIQTNSVCRSCVCSLYFKPSTH
jgi:Fe-coproporphyrin III synthase